MCVRVQITLGMMVCVCVCVCANNPGDDGACVSMSAFVCVGVHACVVVSR